VETCAFDEVKREGTAGGSDLVLSGTITAYEPGVWWLRLLVGLTFGMAYFDADVQLTDPTSGKLVASMAVERISLPIGGPIAALQTPDSLMLSAAQDSAAEVYRAKTGLRLEYTNQFERRSHHHWQAAERTPSPGGSHTSSRSIFSSQVLRRTHLASS
jgi:hypothetical protein